MISKIEMKKIKEFVKKLKTLHTTPLSMKSFFEFLYEFRDLEEDPLRGYVKEEIKQVFKEEIPKSVFLLANCPITSILNSDDYKYIQKYQRFKLWDEIEIAFTEFERFLEDDPEIGNMLRMSMQETYTTYKIASKYNLTFHSILFSRQSFTLEQIVNSIKCIYNLLSVHNDLERFSLCESLRWSLRLTLNKDDLFKHVCELFNILFDLEEFYNIYGSEHYLVFPENLRPQTLFPLPPARHTNEE